MKNLPTELKYMKLSLVNRLTLLKVCYVCKDLCNVIGSEYFRRRWEEKYILKTRSDLDNIGRLSIIRLMACARDGSTVDESYVIIDEIIHGDLYIHDFPHKNLCECQKNQKKWIAEFSKLSKLYKKCTHPAIFWFDEEWHTLSDGEWYPEAWLKWSDESVLECSLRIELIDNTSIPQNKFIEINDKNYELIHKYSLSIYGEYLDNGFGENRNDLIEDLVKNGKNSQIVKIDDYPYGRSFFLSGREINQKMRK